jgi:hypothetical protein
MNPEYPYPPQQPQQPPQPQPSAAPLGQPYMVPGAMPQQPPQPTYAPIQSAPLPPIHSKSSKLWLILTIVFFVTTLAGLGTAVWGYVNYKDQKDNVDSKITAAVAEATKEQADKLAADFAEAEKEPNRLFSGPDDYGRLSFEYPKTWSVYEAKDATSSDIYEAYFNPGVVPPIANDQQYALHVTIQTKDYDAVVDGYKSLVSKGSLTSGAAKIGGENGARLDGMFTKDIRGSAVIFKIRDKTVTIRSDADTFKPDFEALIQTITFNK